jgi:hypothetical protein
MSRIDEARRQVELRLAESRRQAELRLQEVRAAVESEFGVRPRKKVLLLLLAAAAGGFAVALRLPPVRRRLRG